MAEELTLKSRIIIRHDTTEGWAAESVTLKEGEIAYDTDKKALYIGDGTTTFSELTPIGGAASIFTFKGTVDTAEELEEKKQDAQPGDTYQVGTDELALYVYDGDSFEAIGGSAAVDVSGKVDKKVEADTGVSLIENTANGPSLTYQKTDGDEVVGRISVHNGSEEDIRVQLLGGPITEENHCDGPMITLFGDKATYRSKKNTETAFDDPMLEIATLCDIGKVNGFTQEKIESQVGTALIKNDETGGGAWFQRKADGIEGYVGVNNGEDANGRPTPLVQLYAADTATKKDGSFLSVFQDKITYNNKARAAAGAKNGDADSEIAVLADLKGKVDGTITTEKGLAQIVNEETGGSLLYEFTETDGQPRKVSRVSVHDGSGNNVFAQIVAGQLSAENRCLGTTLSVFEDKATYRSQKNASDDINSEDLEIVVKKDLKDFNPFEGKILVLDGGKAKIEE